jgi:hypothetical protein
MNASARQLALRKASLRTPFLAVAIFVTGSSIAEASGGILECGGSNFVKFGFSGHLRPTEWRDDRVFRTPACQMEAGYAAISSELKSMRENGQKKIGLVLWHSDIPTDAQCAGYLINSTRGFQPQILKNLKLFMMTAKSLGFDEVQVRFGPQANNSPRSWKSWDQEKFDHNWSVVESVVEMLRPIEGVNIVYDLGVEIGGADPVNCKYCGEYVEDMWANYTGRFGAAHSYGFSIPYGGGRLARLIRELRRAGPMPNEFALDIYGEDQAAAIVSAAREARNEGVQAPIFLIQETFNSNEETYASILRGVAEANVMVRAVMQWPKSRFTARGDWDTDTSAFVYRPRQMK